MATFDEQYYKGEDLYSDGDIENTLLEIVSRPDYRDHLPEIIGSDFVLGYHLSPIRENIFSWYDFGQGAAVLEIGAGCGAVTGALCQKAGKVVSVDLSRRRSSINFERHKDLPNLQIKVGNFNDMELDGAFDYVVLNGVLEYAMSFTPGDRPYETFLENIARFLKPEGHILIAIENLLGAKYFSGSPEDHLGQMFFGVGGYVGNNTVRTFTRTGLKELLERVGFLHTKFYYPYPDYKFPNEIFSDETIISEGYGRKNPNLDRGRIEFFDEAYLFEGLKQEEILASFANSFLVDAARLPFEAGAVYVDFRQDNDDANARAAMAQPVGAIDWQQVAQQCQPKELAAANQDCFEASLYLDFGQGFSEEHRLSCGCNRAEDGSFEAEFNLSDCDGLVAARFDPVEGRGIYCQITELSAGFSLGENNADALVLKGGELFFHKDPFYHLAIKGKGDRLTIKGTLRFL